MTPGPQLDVRNDDLRWLRQVENTNLAYIRHKGCRRIASLSQWLKKVTFGFPLLRTLHIYGLTLETATPSLALSAGGNETVYKFNEIKMNGVEICECPEHFVGNSCERCETGYRRVNNQLYDGRCEKCNCEGHSDECDPFSGACLNCKHNTTGPRCEQCLPGHYGNPLLGGELGACKQCACPSVDNNHSSQCALSQLVLEGAAAADQDEYVCTACETGYDGNKCEICADGYFGEPAAINGTCQPCSCNGNIDPAAIGNCDRTTGECLRCIGYTDGPSCERCADNHWGSALDHTCRPCGCHHVGAIDLQCSNTTGSCECKEHYIGDRCESCAPGHGDVDSGCPACDCDEVGAIGTECNQVTGQCQCKVGVYGKRCDLCIPSYYNFTENGCSFCHCDDYGSIDQKCSNTTGECECRPNVEGTRCDHCVPGFFNITSNTGCEACGCNELGSSTNECNLISGQCVCKPGVTGVKCDTCLPNHWGLNETGCAECQKCPSPGQVCDPLNGECVCPPNTIGEACESCAPNSWNYDAYTGCVRCDCDGVGADSAECDAVTGQCKCKSGFVGHQCDRCEVGYFNFPDCEPCDCNPEGTDPRECRDNQCICTNEGQCKCKPHVTGLKCDQCTANSFALDAHNELGCTECFCFNRSNFCVQNSLVWQQIYANDRRAYFDEPYESVDRRGNLHVLKEAPQNFNSYLINNVPMYWPLPRNFLGDRTGSYNGFLRFKIWNEDNYRQQHGILPTPSTFKLFPQVILIGNDRLTLEHTAEEISIDNKYKVRLHEKSWRNKLAPQIPVSRAQIMVALQNVQGIYIRGTYNEFYRQDAINLKDVSLDVAVENVTDNASQSTATGVELCGECPEGYAGASCQNPAAGYCRKRAPSYLNEPDDLALVGYASPCACNGHSTVCDSETCRCTECAHNTIGDYCEKCKPGYHGDATAGTPDACVKCACPLASNSFSDTCSSAETGRGYICDACRPGYVGQYCEACVAGYFGDPTIEGGFCEQCACHPFGSLHNVCHNVTGQCDCRPGVTGRDCSSCSPRHAFINQVCTSCDQGCYSPLMQLEDELERDLETVQNLTDAKPIPHKRLRKIDDAVDSYHGILESIKLSEASAADLVGPDGKAENRNIKQANAVIEDAKVLRERANDAQQRLAELQKDVEDIRNIEHAQNRRVHDISTQLAAFTAHVTNSQSSGNADHLVKEAEQYLETIKEREREIEKQLNYATKNAEDADALLTKVLAKKLNESSYKDLRDQYKEKHALLKAFRDTIWDDAKANSTAAKKLTEVVNNRLEQLKDTVAEIEKAAAEQKDTHAKTAETIEAIKQELLNSHDFYKEISENLLEKVKESSAKARAKIEEDLATLRENKHKAHKAEQHAKDLSHAARKLKHQIDETKSVANETLTATNAYKDIVEALVNASAAAEKAKSAAESAFADIGQDTDNSIVDLAAAKLNDSKKLKESFADADGSDIAEATQKLRAVLDKVQKTAKEIQEEAKKVKDSQGVLDDHEDRINNIHLTVASSKDASDTAASSVDKFVNDVDELAHRVAAATNFNEQAIAEDIANVTATTADLAASLAKLNSVSDRSAGHTDELRSVKDQLAVLREKLNEAKERASKVRISISSDPRKACSRAYISPAHPSPTNTISLKYRPALDVPDSLLFLTLTKSRRTAAREFLAIELRDRRIIVHWNIGSGSRRATNSHNIAYIPASDRYTWYHIDVTRIGNAVRVSVGQKQTLGGEGAKNVDEPTEAVLGEPDATSEVVLNTVPGETKVHVGHEDTALATDLGLGTNKFAGVLGELTVDGTSIPLWVFASQTGQCDGAAGAPTTSASGHFFRNGFAQVRMPMSERQNTLIRIVYSAYSPDGLLYFRGSPTSGDFVSVELREGAIWVKARYGDDAVVEVHSALASYADGRVHRIRITKKAAEIELSVDDDADREAVAVAGAGTSPARISDEDPHFVGGVSPDFDKSPFEARGINWAGFVGCIQVVKPNQVSELDLDHPVRSQRVQPGCTFKSDRLLPADRVIGFPKPGYVVTESVILGSNSSLAFNLRTTNANAVLLYQKALKSASKRDADPEDPTFFAFYLYNGRLIVHLGTDVTDRLKRPSLSSNYTYNDGRLHNVFLARTPSAIEVRIDDREVLKSHFADETPIGSPDAKLYFGGLPARLRSPNDGDDMGTTEPLIGCLSDFYFNFERWSIVPEEHQALLGTCTLDAGFDTASASEESGEAPQGFERKNSKLSLALAAPTYVSDDAKALTEYDLVGPSPSTCKAAIPANASALLTANGVRYGATESSNSRIGFDRPRPDFKNFKIEFSFKTDSPDGMLWVWANYKNYTRYYLLYLDEGFLTFASDNARGRQKLYAYKERKFDDGEWHFVDFRKQEHEVRLQVDNLDAETFKDVPNARVMVKRLYVGGVISRHKKLFAFPKGNFKGCIKDFSVDGVIRDLVENSRDLVTCKETTGISYIHSGGFASFSGLKNYGTESFARDAIEIQFRFRSTNLTGTLVALASQNDEAARLFVTLEKNHLVFKAYDSERDFSIEHRIPLPSTLCPSEWHRFHVTLTGDRLILRLDDTQGTHKLAGFSPESIETFRALPVNIGGVSANIAVAANVYSLNGCIQDIQLSGTPTAIAKAKRLHKIIENGCPLV
uniref:Laminin EGF-like domain-containing protein n=1 Tax=Panagrellus redivivus TaxID=6233 RepID=A0A7E4VA92_PANRE